MGRYATLEGHRTREDNGRIRINPYVRRIVTTGIPPHVASDILDLVGGRYSLNIELLSVQESDAQVTGRFHYQITSTGHTNLIRVGGRVGSLIAQRSPKVLLPSLSEPYGQEPIQRPPWYRRLVPFGRR